MAEAYAGNDELWRDCVVWLTRWEVLRKDHRANWPQATIVDLATTLRDGVLLCTLLSKMDPGCIDMKMVNMKPMMAQVLHVNINVAFRFHCCFVVFVSEEY